MSQDIKVSILSKPQLNIEPFDHTDIYTVSQKNWATFVFTVTGKFWPILKIISLPESEIIST